MPTELIVHSLLHGSTLTHSVQSDNLARLKTAVRHLVSLGYEVRTPLRSERGYHEVTLWSWHDREYTSVRRSLHTDLLRALRLSVNNIAVQTPTVISTYATVKHSRSRRRRPTSPVRPPSWD